jgi:hypothetical protein
MSGSLNGRVSRLENGRAGPCEECGFDGDWSNIEIVVEWDDVDALEAPAKEDAPEPKFFGTCGHQLEYVVTWVDLPELEGT